jgi:hypothetical protein
MHRFSRYCLLTTALVAMTLLFLSRNQRRDYRAASQQSINDWSILELADHLKRAGLEVQVQSTRKDGVIDHTTFLTTTDKDWNDLNRLFKDPRWFQAWGGTVHCERLGKGEHALHLLDDHYLVAGPFVFYGDTELLKRIGGMLAPSTASVAPSPGTMPGRH